MAERVRERERERGRDRVSERVKEKERGRERVAERERGRERERERERMISVVAHNFNGGWRIKLKSYFHYDFSIHSIHFISIKSG